MTTEAGCTTGLVQARFGADGFVTIGRRYTARGDSDGDGWIEVQGNHAVPGWSLAACFIDGPI
jgi:hypothetical protein